MECTTLVGYYEGTFKAKNKFDHHIAQFELLIEPNITTQEFYLTWPNYNASYGTPPVDYYLHFNDGLSWVSCNNDGPCKTKFTDHDSQFIVHIHFASGTVLDDSRLWSSKHLKNYPNLALIFLDEDIFDLMYFPTFFNTFKLKNPSGHCTKDQLRLNYYESVPRMCHIFKKYLKVFIEKVWNFKKVS